MKVRAKIKHRVIECYPYPDNVLISIQQMANEFEASCKKYLEPELFKKFKEDGLCEPDPTHFGVSYNFKNGQHILRVKEVKGYCSHNIIAHETFHIATEILERAGVKLEMGVSDEAYAYLIGYITEQVYKML